MAVSKERMYVVLNDTFVPPKEFNDKRLRFSTPTVVDKYDRNTMVTIYGIPGKGYYGEVDVYYNRVDVSELLYRFKFKTNIAFNKKNIVESFTNYVQEDFTLDDFSDFETVSLANGDVLDTSIDINPDSLQWIGTLALTLENGLPELETAVGRKSVGLFEHPNPEYRKRYGRMLGWNVDFTGALDIIGPFKGPDDGIRRRSNYTDWAAVRRLTATLGWPAWIEGNIVDLPTSQVPEANPKFERVIVQSSGTSGSMRAPIYFHYNPVAGY